MKMFKQLAFALVSVLLLFNITLAQTYRPWVRTIDLTVANVPVFEAGLGVETSGDVWYVDSGATGTAAGTSWTNACLTVDAAVALATADNGDVIRVAASHAGDGTFSLSKAGLTVFHHGSLGGQATYTFAATGSTITISAANCRIIGGRFLAGISAVVAGFTVAAGGDNFQLIDAVFPEPTTSSFEFVDAIDLASGADGVQIIRPVQFTADATGADHFIDAGNGVNNNLQIIDAYLYGEYAVSAIWSDTTDLEVLISGGTITNLTNAQHAIEFVTGTALGTIEYILVRTDAQGTAVDPGSMSMHNVYWDDDAVADAVSAPVVLGATGPASIGTINSTTTDSIHGKIGTDTEMGDVSLYDQYIADQVDLDAILADTISISGATLPAAPTSGSLATYISGGSTALGQPLPASMSLIDIIGNYTGAYDGIAADDNIKAQLDLITAQMEQGVTGSTAVMVNGDTIFTIAGGPIEVMNLVSVCISGNDGTASTLQYSADPTVGGAITFSAASASLANFAAGGGVIINMTALNTAPDLSTVLVGLGPVQANRIVINEGIITIVIGTGSTTGTWKHYLRYRPLGPGITVTGT